MPRPQEHWRDLDPALQAAAAPDRLILPHPRLQDRAFVLVPLADVAPDWRHPVLGQTVRRCWRRCPQAERGCGAHRFDAAILRLSRLLAGLT